MVWCVYLCGGRFVYRYGVALQAGVSLWMMFSKVLGTILLSWGECKRLHYCTLVGLAYCFLGPCLRSPSSFVSHALWWRLVWAYVANSPYGVMGVCFHMCICWRHEHESNFPDRRTRCTITYAWITLSIDKSVRIMHLSVY